MIERLNTALEGRYRIERELGEGGMAFVYLADDLKHNRKVALKVLKADLAQMLGKDRFFSEIETTAQLQHPNILPLFDSGEADGLLFYAMPYVEGETLGDKLKREVQLPVDQALDLIRKVAAALSYAHERGVVHRDIKPANILLSSGEPLVADFGIALAVQQAGEGRMTQTGLSMGTPQYMSPEQASGDRSLDPRSDIYALGCVLYEMLSGDPPFAGSSAQAVLARILTTLPSRVTVQRPTVPPHVDAAIARSLEKIPADRFTTANDFRKALDDPSFRHTTVTGIESGEQPRVLVRRKGGPLVPILSGGLVLAIIVAGLGWLRPEPEPEVQRFRIDLPVGSFAGPDFALSPDGRTVVFVGEEGGLYQRPMDGLEATAIPGGGSGQSPVFSPDGSSIAFKQGSGREDRWVTLDLAGGSPVPIAPSITNVQNWAGWSDDGNIYFVQSTSPGRTLYRASEQGGTVEAIPMPEGTIPYWPSSIAGHDDRILLAVERDGSDVVMVMTETGEVVDIQGLEGAFDARYANGYLFWVDASLILFGARFDPTIPALTSSPVSLSPGMADDGAFSVSESGVLLYRTSSGADFSGGENVGWLDAEGVAEIIDPRLAQDFSDIDDVKLSPDERYMVLEVQTATDGSAEERHHLHVYDLTRGTSYQLTFDGRENRNPRWLGNDRIAYVSDRSGQDAIWVQSFDRSDEARVLFDPGQPISDFDVSPDPQGPLAVSLSGGPDGPRTPGIYVLDQGETEPSNVITATRFTEFGAAISPDGRWVAYSSDETGRSEIYARAFPDGGRPWPIAIETGGAPRWSRIGNSIIYRSQRNFESAGVDTRDGVEVTGRNTLFEVAGIEQLTNGASFDLAGDSRMLAILEVSRQRTDGDVISPVIVTNIFADIERRLREGNR